MNKLTCVLFIALFFGACKSNNKTLPISGNREIVTKIVNGQTVTDTVYQTIPPFKFINQYGDSISDKNLAGKIYVADFFFTSCPDICPKLQRNMLDVYRAFKTDSDIKILSYTIDPKYDSVPVLKKYAERLDINGNMWWFLQGKKADTYRLAMKYLVRAGQDSSAAGGYIHEGWFVLIDKQKRIRGAYDGTKPQEVAQLITDIKILKTEKTDE